MESSTQLYRFRRHAPVRSTPRTAERVRLSGMQGEKETGRWVVAIAEADSVISPADVSPAPQNVDMPTAPVSAS